MQGSIPIQQVVIIILHFRGVCQVYFSPDLPPVFFAMIVHKVF